MNKYKRRFILWSKPGIWSAAKAMFQTATWLDLESMAQMVFIKVNQKLDFWQSKCLYGRALETLAVFMHSVILIIYVFSWYTGAPRFWKNKLLTWQNKSRFLKKKHPWCITFQLNLFIVCFLSDLSFQMKYESIYLGPFDTLHLPKKRSAREISLQASFSVLPFWWFWGICGSRCWL